MSQNDTNAFDSTVSGTNGDTGIIHVPADAQREQGITIDDSVEVTLSDLDHDFIDSVTFEGRQCAGDAVTVPAEIMRKVGIDGGQPVTAEFEKVTSELEEGAEALEDSAEEMDDSAEELEEMTESLANSPGASDSDDEQESEADDEEEESTPGLGELFG